MLPAELIRFKQTGRPITILTAWDSLSSSIVEAAGADVVLVGDSCFDSFSYGFNCIF